MKWLTEITVRADESPGYYMQQAYRISGDLDPAGSGLPGSAMVPVEQMLVKSLIAVPADGDYGQEGPGDDSRGGMGRRGDRSEGRGVL